MDWRSLMLLALFAWAWEARAAAPDPVTSVMWDYYHQRLLTGEAFVFDDKVRLEVPPFAEDARQVPIQIDASAYSGKVKRILAWAELNPIPRILDFAPGEHLEPSLAIRIRVEQHERVLGYIEAGKRDGASVVMGGDAPSSDGGYFVNPTVLVDVNPQMSVVREEIFGPVVVAQRFDDLDEVAKAANDTCFGLGAGIWTKDVATMHKLAAKIKSGTVWGNCHAVIDTALPFGGYKLSGVGRENGHAAIEHYSQVKSVYVGMGPVDAPY